MINDDVDDCGANCGMTVWHGKLKYSDKLCPSAALSTKNPIRIDQGSNPGRGDGNPAITRLGYGTTIRIAP
jgi:hypothetical protein